MNSKLVEMLNNNQIPMIDGLWIDTYNKITNPDVAGTIRCSINSANMHYVMEIIDDTQLPPPRTDTTAFQHG